jgi:GT2 family glycosyltransferase
MKIGIVMKCVDAISSIETVHTYEVRIVPNYRLGWPLSHAWNEGIEWSGRRGHDFTLIINDDILFAPTTIDNMVEQFLIFESEQSAVMMTGSNICSSMSSPYDILSFASDSCDAAEHPDFSCFMVRPNILDKVGYFDENFVPAYYEDNDYHYRINLSGHKAFSTTSAPYLHYGSQSMKEATSHTQDHGWFFPSNSFYYVSKWGGDPGNEIFVTPYNNDSLSYKDWKDPNEPTEITIC